MRISMGEGQGSSTRAGHGVSYWLCLRPPAAGRGDADRPPTASRSPSHGPVTAPAAARDYRGRGIGVAELRGNKQSNSPESGAGVVR